MAEPGKAARLRALCMNVLKHAGPGLYSRSNELFMIAVDALDAALQGQRATTIIEALDDAAVPRWRPLTVKRQRHRVWVRCEGAGSEPWAVQAAQTSNGRWLTRSGDEVFPTHWYPRHPELDALPEEVEVTDG